jgi:hypothetical protein
MVTRELLVSEIKQLDEEYLEQVYAYVKNLVEVKKKPKKEKSFLEKLAEFHIENGPDDLSINHDLYFTGEKP